MARRSRAVERGTAGPGPAASAWAPLRIRLFRTLWIASLVSNVGTWMQTVGAQWLVVHSARNTPIRNGAQADESGLASAMPHLSSRGPEPLDSSFRADAVDCLLPASPPGKLAVVKMTVPVGILARAMGGSKHH